MPMRLGALLALGAVSAFAQVPASRESGVETRLRQSIAEKVLERGAAYLLAAQDKEGGWASDKGPGISALALKALAQAPSVGPSHPAVQRGVENVLTFQRDDGGVYSAMGLFKNYETSVVVSMLGVLDGKQHAKALETARKFLLDNQADEVKGKSIDDDWYGGAGYFFGKRPDLSNTQMMVEALRDSGLPADDPAYKKALIFISRCQMLGEANDRDFAKGSTQGGFIYTAANGGDSKAGKIEIGGRSELRCYGSMTYAGFKSLIYCGLSKDDPRVQAALGWIARNWTLDYNPNMPEKQSREGLFYYYHTFGRALAAWGEAEIKDSAGRVHDWRAELVEKLARLQQDDGSWVNPADRWMEGQPALTTAYAMLALEAAFPPERKGKSAAGER